MQRLNTRQKSVSIHTGTLILVNGAHPFLPPENLDLDVVDTRYPEILAERSAVTLYRQALAAVGTGNIVPVSGYRGLAEQQSIWDETVRDKGLSFTKKYVAQPGHSEHHTGLAIDLAFRESGIEPDFICPSFPYDGPAGIFRKAALRHGFVERYAKGKEHITGIAHEPWHFRYVGFPHSVIMQAHDLCLEEYVDFIRNYDAAEPLVYYATNYRIEVYFDPAPELPASGDAHTQVSGNNVDGYILTKWKYGHA